jgi:hypothetical protein
MSGYVAGTSMGFIFNYECPPWGAQEGLTTLTTEKCHKGRVSLLSF